MQNRGTGAVAGVSARSLIGSLLSSPPEPKDIASGALARTAEVTLLYCAADFWFHSDPGGTEQEPLLLADKLQRNATALALAVRAAPAHCTLALALWWIDAAEAAPKAHLEVALRLLRELQDATGASTTVPHSMRRPLLRTICRLAGDPHASADVRGEALEVVAALGLAEHASLREACNFVAVAVLHARALGGGVASGALERVLALVAQRRRVTATVELVEMDAPPRGARRAVWEEELARAVGGALEGAIGCEGVEVWVDWEETRAKQAEAQDQGDAGSVVVRVAVAPEGEALADRVESAFQTKTTEMAAAVTESLAHAGLWGPEGRADVCPDGRRQQESRNLLTFAFAVVNSNPAGQPLRPCAAPHSAGFAPGRCAGVRCLTQFWGGQMTTTVGAGEGSAGDGGAGPGASGGFAGLEGALVRPLEQHVRDALERFLAAPKDAVDRLATALVHSPDPHKPSDPMTPLLEAARTALDTAAPLRLALLEALLSRKFAAAATVAAACERPAQRAGAQPPDASAAATLAMQTLAVLAPPEGPGALPAVQVQLTALGRAARPPEPAPGAAAQPQPCRPSASAHGRASASAYEQGIWAGLQRTSAGSQLGGGGFSPFGAPPVASPVRCASATPLSRGRASLAGSLASSMAGDTTVGSVASGAPSPFTPHRLLRQQASVSMAAPVALRSSLAFQDHAPYRCCCCGLCRRRHAPRRAFPLRQSAAVTPLGGRYTPFGASSDGGRRTSMMGGQEASLDASTVAGSVTGVDVSGFAVDEEVTFQHRRSLATMAASFSVPCFRRSHPRPNSHSVLPGSTTSLAPAAVEASAFKPPSFQPERIAARNLTPSHFAWVAVDNYLPVWLSRDLLLRAPVTHVWGQYFPVKLARVREKYPFTDDSRRSQSEEQCESRVEICVSNEAYLMGSSNMECYRRVCLRVNDNVENDVAEIPWSRTASSRVPLGRRKDARGVSSSYQRIREVRIIHSYVDAYQGSHVH